MNDKLYNMLLSLPKQLLLNVMLAALDEMRRYNGQSNTSAIMRAIDAKKSEDGRYWQLPSAEVIAREFEKTFQYLDM